MALCEIRILTGQGLFNPGSGLFGGLEQGRVSNDAFTEPGFQVPQARAFELESHAVQVDHHGGRLVVREDQFTLADTAIDEHAQGLERDREGHSLRLPCWGEGSVAKWPDTQNCTLLYHKEHNLSCPC